MTQKGPKTAPREAQEGDQKFKNLAFRPERAPRGPKRAPRGPKEAPTSPQEAPERPQEAPKRPPRGFKTASQRLPRGVPRDPKRRLKRRLTYNASTVYRQQTPTKPSRGPKDSERPNSDPRRPPNSPQEAPKILIRSLLPSSGGRRTGVSHLNKPTRNKHPVRRAIITASVGREQPSTGTVAGE